MTSNSLDRFARHTIGFESLLNEINNLANHNTYPPHNIVEIHENEYVLEYALAGFRKEDIEVREEDGTLIVAANPEKEERKYLHKGISSRSFKNTFKLSEHVKVHSAHMSNGLLSVTLVREVPEEKKPKIVKITS